MGILEDIEAMDLADDVKATLRASAIADINAKDEEANQLRRDNRRDKIEAEVKGLATLFGDSPETIGLQKFTRRVFLSENDTDGAVLLTDDELQLSDDQKTGSKHREEVTPAGVLREFVKLMPRAENGQISLSDLVSEQNDSGRPEGVGADQRGKDTDGARERLGAPKRSRKRYQGGRPSLVTGGDN